MTSTTGKRREGDLLARIEAFDIDGGECDFTFAQRLARENGWTPGFAERVIVEYKRFVFLCCDAGHPCTPSEHVDQAWHLHLTFTQSYWERLCQQTLTRPLHHNPTKGGGSERDKFNDWYARTKQSYERLVGHPPPEDIWPPHEKRFGTDLRWERVNTATHWIVRKPSRRAAAAIALLLLAPIIIAGCADGSAPPGDIISIVACAAVPLFLLIWLLIRKGGGSGGGGFFGCGGFFGDSGCGGDAGCGGGCGGCGGCGG